MKMLFNEDSHDYSRLGLLAGKPVREIFFNSVITRECRIRGRSGICEKDCGRGGQGYGSCIDGSSCCLYVYSCNGEAKEKSFYFQNPSFPAADSYSDSCTMKIRIRPNVCGIRFDFLRFRLGLPRRANLNCKSDSFNIIANNTNGLCGMLDGYAVTIPVEKGKVYQKLSVLTRSRRYQWNVIISQIDCNSLARPTNYKYCGLRRLFGVSPNEINNDDSITVESESRKQVDVSAPQEEGFFKKEDFVPNEFLIRYLSSLVTQDKAPVQLSERVYKGVTAQRGEFPWQALLQRGYTIFCGGSLITDRFVVTAAHCIITSDRESIVPSLSVRFGERSYNEYPWNLRQVVKAKKIHLHHSYDQQDLTNDIALIELEKPVLLSQGVYPVCLPSPGKIHSEVNGIVSGFGKINSQKRTSFLNWADVVIWANRRCGKSWGSETPITQVCARGNRGQDTCEGDSGGPLIASTRSGSYELVGITSFGDTCGSSFLPGVYTRISVFLEWMTLVMAHI
ncbi:transmembrane protease serine 11B-like protein isoform X2 [Artemia franciscana]|uniref:transmembrane protease serine 11B-like protein isoform X2 n=1 Tax=Artemia franciscana TaxID=6661 RepID=UPI0032DAF8C2